MLASVHSEYFVPEESVASMVERLGRFIEPYRMFFGRKENHDHANMYLSGRLQRLDRRTLEPIANENGVHRRALQHFVGAGPWDDAPIMDTFIEQVAEELGTPKGVLIFDASGFQKWGKKSVGVQRQWCGRLGKRENCQVGEFLAYASSKGHTLVDHRLYLPQSWIDDRQRCNEAHVPSDVTFQKGWELSYAMLKERSAALPHRWVLGDDAYGRVVALRKKLDADNERYLLEVPSNTQVRLHSRNGKEQSVASIASSLPAKAWKRVRTRDGEKGPIQVQAFKTRVTTGTADDSRRETLLLTKNPKTGEHWYYLSNASPLISVSTMAKAAACRHYIEQSFELAKGDVGLGEYEVRSWVGWHHHMTLSLLALFFLVCERNRLKKNSSPNHPAGSMGYRKFT